MWHFNGTCIWKVVKFPTYILFYEIKWNTLYTFSNYRLSTSLGLYVPSSLFQKRYPWHWCKEAKMLNGSFVNKDSAVLCCLWKSRCRQCKNECTPNELAEIFLLFFSVCFEPVSSSALLLSLLPLNDNSQK